MNTTDFSFRPLRLPEDAALLHRWVSTEQARFWGLTGASRQRVQEEYRQLLATKDYRVLLGERDGQPRFLVELYDPATSPLAEAYHVVPGDVGLHLLVPAPPAAAEPGFTLAAMAAALAHAFTGPGTERVVVEPDLANKPIQALNARVGFRPAGQVRLTEADGSQKHALLSLCTRADFEQATGLVPSPGHLRPGHWQQAHHHLLAKAIGEFSHERLLHPQPLPEGRYRVEGHGHRYEFQARRYLLEHWQVQPASLRHWVFTDQAWQPDTVDVLDFVTVFAHELTLSPQQLPTYVEELTSTLASHCYKQQHAQQDSGQLAEFAGTPAQSFQRIEAAMTEGHPCFVANNGRIGVGRGDYLRYAPETGAETALGWVAAHHNRATFTHLGATQPQVQALDHLLRQQLGAAELRRLRGQLEHLLAGTDRDPDQYLLIPVHPWQWEHRLATTFANDVARGELLWLGHGADRYQPQQSIRTFFNLSHPRRHYVKTAMSILNMGFMRGLSADYMQVTPAINEWLQELFDTDEFLRDAPVGLLREVAAVGYRNRQYEAATIPGAAQRKMLAALWRESPLEALEPGQNLATMASLLHVDGQGHSFVGALIRRSGLPARTWMERYLDAYLIPLVHCLAAYDLVFMPHGENVILVLRDGAVDKVLLKDLGEEIAVLSDRVQLPEHIRRVRTGGDPVLSVFTDVFDSFFRFLAPLLDAEGLLAQEEFWALVAERLLRYRRQNPAQAQHFDALGLFTEAFPLSCLNRLQLRNNQQMLDLSDQSSGLLYAGELQNPLSGLGDPAAVLPGRPLRDKHLTGTS